MMSRGTRALIVAGSPRPIRSALTQIAAGLDLRFVRAGTALAQAIAGLHIMASERDIPIEFLRPGMALIGHPGSDEDGPFRSVTGLTYSRGRRAG